MDRQLVECPFLKVQDSQASAFCSLVTENLPTISTDKARVNETTCRTCLSFFVPSSFDLNPIVASLLFRATQGIDPYASQRDRARRHLIQPLADAYLNPDATSIRSGANALDECDHHRDTETHDLACIQFVRSRENVMGRNAHRSGWPFAVEALRDLGCRQGILFDDFVEQRFCYHMGLPGYSEPWIGVFHHPPDDPNLLGKRFMLKYLFETRIWKKSAKYLKGAIALTEFLASFLREHLEVPVEVVKHPAAMDVAQWSPDAFVENASRRLVQVGWFGRNTKAIYDIPDLQNFRKMRVLPSGCHFDEYDARIAQILKHDFNPQKRSAVEDRTCLSSDEYREVMIQHVLFTEMVAASANNVVLDAIASNTPIVINRHPAVVEYLTPEYPLYFDSRIEIPELLTDEKVLSAHRFLKSIDKSWMTADSFRRSMADAVSRIHGWSNESKSLRPVK